MPGMAQPVPVLFGETSFVRNLGRYMTLLASQLPFVQASEKHKVAKIGRICGELEVH